MINATYGFGFDKVNLSATELLLSLGIFGVTLVLCKIVGINFLPPATRQRPNNCMSFSCSITRLTACGNKKCLESINLQILYDDPLSQYIEDNKIN